VFTAVGASPLTNFVIDYHDYAMSTNFPSQPNYSATGSYGEAPTGNIIQTDDTTHPAYPPTVSGTAVPRATCQSQRTAMLASTVAYCAASYANVPLFIGEWGWAPKSGTTTFSGGTNWITDSVAAWQAAGAVAMLQWDYNVTQSQDDFAARPGTGAAGVNPDGWQTVTDTFFSLSAPVTTSGGLTLAAPGIAASGAGGNATASGVLPLGAMGITADAGETLTAAGSVALAPFGTAGTAGMPVPVTASGSLAQAPMAPAGSGMGGDTSASGSAALAPMAPAGGVAGAFTASGSVTLASPGLAATGFTGTVTGTGSMALAPVGMAGTASGPVTSSGSLALAPLASGGGRRRGVLLAFPF
jgi:hypothetical protein